MTRLLAPAVLLALLLTSCRTAADADGSIVRYDGANVYGFSGATSVVTRGERIAFVGAPDAAVAQYPNARVVDLSGRTVLPGLVDAHGHVDGLGQALANADLIGSKSVDDMLDRVAAFASDKPAGEWILGRGWDQNEWAVKEFPTAAQVDARIADRPVLLERVDGHATLANTAAMRAAGITRDTRDPEGGRIIRDSAGNPTGVFVDAATSLLDEKVPEPTRAQRSRRVRAALADIAAHGLTGVHDAGADGETISILRELSERGELPVRVYVMLTDDDKLLREWFARGALVDLSRNLTVRAVKLYADGALGSRGAALLAPYSDDPKNSGLEVSRVEHMTDIAKRARAAGFQVGTHAIGDRGVRNVLDAYAAAGVTPADRFRIEHLQVAALEDFPRIAKMGVIASMQPTHATSDMDWAERRVGHDRIRGAYAWRRVLDAHIPLALGSDFPVERVSPFLGLHAAVTRQDVAGDPPGGWYPDQELTIDEAVAGFTKGAAYAAFEEKDLGEIAVGKLADFTIIDGDLTEPLHNKTVRMTVVGGKVVYQK